MSLVAVDRAKRVHPDPDSSATHLSDGTSPAYEAVATGSEAAAVHRSLWRDYLELTKPEITFLVALSSLGGFLLAPPEWFDAGRMIFLLIGVTMTSGGASVLNHWLERSFDGNMRRTMTRPLPSGRIGPNAARNFGFLLLAAGVSILCPLTNPLTGILAFGTAMLYLFVYTPLKRVTKWNTLIGTIPGALPALGGWTAATGSVGWAGWSFFAILAAWQMPHFLALAWMYRKDYARGGHVMLPVADPSGTSTVRQTLFFTLVLAGVSLLPLGLGLVGWIYGAAAVGLGVWFIYVSFVFFRTYSVRDARSVLKVSIYYVPALVLAILVDRLVLNVLFAG